MYLDYYTQQRISVNNHAVMTFSGGECNDVILMLSGGPGAPCDYLLDGHKQFIAKGYRVISWDQLGCGRSDQPTDETLWEIPRFVEEVETVRRELRLGKVHLLGESWGGILGLEYILAYPDNVKTFIIDSSTFNVPLMQQGFERHKLALGHETMRMMLKHEAAGTTDHPEYQGAFNILAFRHLCRLAQWPESALATMNLARPMLEKMFGKYLFNCSGLLRNYDRIKDCHKVKQPCLIIHGEYDYIIPDCALLARDHLPNAELHILKDCSHSTFLEDRETYTSILLNFLENQKKLKRDDCAEGNVADSHFA